jgi:hypothetical protein
VTAALLLFTSCATYHGMDGETVRVLGENSFVRIYTLDCPAGTKTTSTSAEALKDSHILQTDHPATQSSTSEPAACTSNLRLEMHGSSLSAVAGSIIGTFVTTLSNAAIAVWKWMLTPGA